MQKFKQIFLINLLSVLSVNLNAQSLPPKQAYPLNVKQLHCGHSLTDPLFSPWPGQYVELVASLNNQQGWQAYGSLVGSATLPGAWIRFHWDTTITWCGQNPPPCYEPNMRPIDDIHLWDLLVITENYEGPLVLNAHNSRENLLNFVNNSWQYGRSGQGAATLLWTNWGGLDDSPYFLSGHGINPDTTGAATGWRLQLDTLEKGWHAMQDYANANRPSGCPPVYIIPGNRMMAQLYDDIQNNLVPTITHINQIFTDGVHLNDLGAYLVTMIHYACIFNANPVGLSHQLHPNVTVPQSFATYAQNMIWNLVTNYPRSGIYTSTNKENSYNSNRYTLYPTPSSDLVWLISHNPLSQENPLFIYNMNGQLVKEVYRHPFSISELPKGVYITRFYDEIQKLVKE